jgi:PHD/YefM family antitoxin component YafN of YafNO toxin-antitoxin module
MLRVKNIHSVTDFARNTRDHVKRLKGSGDPEVLTMNGKAAVVVQDAEAYQRLLDLVDYVDTVRTLRERLSAFKKGSRGRSMRKVIEELAIDAVIDLKRA